MGNTQDRPMKLTELAERAKLPPRTIRLYIARGLMDAPDRLGRGAQYGNRHLERLKEIRKLQGRGMTLREIAHALGDKDTGAAPPPSQAYRLFQIAEDVAVHVPTDVSPHRMRQIRRALGRLAQELGQP